MANNTILLWVRLIFYLFNFQNVKEQTIRYVVNLSLLRARFLFHRLITENYQVDSPLVREPLFQAISIPDY